MSKIKTITQSMRLPFLILTPVCVFLGASTVIASDQAINIFHLLLALLGGLLAHIGVNTLNEHHDFHSGLDLNTTPTPFSGGSGALPANPHMSPAVLYTGIFASLATFAIGIYFVWQYGMGIIPIGLAGLFLMVTYTGWINKQPFLCLIAPGVGFGLLMVVGTQFVLQGSFSTQTLLLSLIPFFTTNNLLLLNQYPDIEADKKVGRYHYPIAFGVEHSNIMYSIFAIAPMLLIIFYVLLDVISAWGLLALLPASLAFFSLSGATTYKAAIGSHPHYLAANVATAVLTPLVLAITISF